MPSFLTKARQILREKGIRGLAQRIALRVYRRREMVIVVHEIGEESEVPFLPRHPYVMRFLTPADLPLIAPHVPLWRLEEYRRRLARGVRGCACLTANERECLGWVWFTDEPYYEAYDNATYRAVPGSVYIFDGWVVSEKRGRGVGFTAHPLMWHWARVHGHTRCHSAIEQTNRPSLKVHERMGYTPRDKMTVHTLLGIKWAGPAGLHIGPGDETGRG